MALQWQEAPQQDPGSSLRSSESISGNNPWFAVAMGLLGTIIGYVLGNLLR